MKKLYPKGKNGISDDTYFNTLLLGNERVE